MKTIKILDELDIEIQQQILAHPELNSTELAQLLAGGYKADKYPEYVKYLQSINYLKDGNN